MLSIYIPHTNTTLSHKKFFKNWTKNFWPRYTWAMYIEPLVLTHTHYNSNGSYETGEIIINSGRLLFELTPGPNFLVTPIFQCWIILYREIV